MADNLSIRVPEGPVAHVVELVAKIADLAVRYRLGQLQASSAAPGTTNACEDEGCDFLEKILVEGQWWNVYFCDNQLVVYPA